MLFLWASELFNCLKLLVEKCGRKITECSLDVERPLSLAFYHNLCTQSVQICYGSSLFSHALQILNGCMGYQSGKFVLCDRDLGRAVLMFPIYFIVNF